MAKPDSAGGGSASAAARSVAMPTDCSPRVTLAATAPRPCGETTADARQVGCEVVEGHHAGFAGSSLIGAVSIWIQPEDASMQAACTIDFLPMTRRQCRRRLSSAGQVQYMISHRLLLAGMYGCWQVARHAGCGPATRPRPQCTAPPLCRGRRPRCRSGPSCCLAERIPLGGCGTNRM